MNKLKKLICISMITIVLVNTILPDLSFAVMSYEDAVRQFSDNEEITPLIESIEYQSNENIKNIINQDDDNYSKTKEYLNKMNSYIEEFARQGDDIILKIQAEDGEDEWSAELKNEIKEFKEYINKKPGLKDYLGDNYTNYLLKKIDVIENLTPTEYSQPVSVNLSTKMTYDAYLISALTATEGVIEKYVNSADDTINEQAIKKLEAESTLDGLSEDEQAKEIIKEIEQKISQKIESLTEDDKNELKLYIESLIDGIEQENVSDTVKQKVMDYINSRFYINGELNIDEIEALLDVFLDGEEEIVEKVYYDPLERFFSTILNGLLGILIYPFKLILLVPGVLIYGIGEFGGLITLDKIFFNEVDMTNINIFDIEGATGNALTMRQSIAEFYVTFRNLAIVLSLAVLIYIGIQMAINSIAEQKAKYKQMLTNWAVGFGLIFILHYIIIFTINANEMLVAGLRAAQPETDYMSQILKQFLIQAWLPAFTTSFTSIAMYTILLVSTLIFLVIYIKRMITISFLIIIAPLISVTYSIDKIDNNRSEILNTWIKEFMYNVLIQPFHCIIYSVFIGTAMELIEGTGSLDFGATTFAIILTFCIFLGQKIIREIFGFSQASSLTQKVAMFAMVKNVTSTIKTAVAIKGARNEKIAQKRMKQLPSKMPDGNSPNIQNLNDYRVLAEQNRMNEEANAKGGQGAGGASQPSPQNNTRPGTKQKVEKRRIIKNLPSPVKRILRASGDVVKKVSGYDMTKEISKKRDQNRVLHMTEADYFIAGSEMFRQKQQIPMNNEQLAKRMEQLYDENDINKLKPEEVNYKLLIDSMKTNFSKQEMIDSIKNGTSDNKRWRK